MKLKNVLIVVNDTDASEAFYHDVFGLTAILRREGNVIMTEGLVLQDKKIWEQATGRNVVQENNAMELYFETMDRKDFAQRLEKYADRVEFVGQPLNGQEEEIDREIVRFYDLDRNLIEVRFLR